MISIVEILHSDKCQKCVYRDKVCPINKNGHCLCEYDVSDGKRDGNFHFENLPSHGEPVLFKYDGKELVGVYSCMSDEGLFLVAAADEIYETRVISPITDSFTKNLGNEWRE